MYWLGFENWMNESCTDIVLYLRNSILIYDSAYCKDMHVMN